MSLHPLYIRDLPYSEPAEPLRSLDIYFLHGAPLKEPSLWIIYIHGGAWRDPLIDKSSIGPALAQLLRQASPAVARVEAVASLNYRLAPYPTHPTDPSRPGDGSRNSGHPGQIRDVIAALRFLQHEYPAARRWIAVGHSAGGTLAWQSCVPARWHGAPPDLPAPVAPLAVVGLAGVYDLPLFAASHGNDPAYRDIVENAFHGPGAAGDWQRASPVSGEYGGGAAAHTVLAVLAYSVDDELVECDQVQAMLAALVDCGWRQRAGFGDVDALAITQARDAGEKAVLVKELRGSHDDLWRDGNDLAALLLETASALVSGLK